MSFPKDFLWGAATASYQIEGAALEDGRGECIWTRFSHTPGKVMNGDTGDIACDHYHRYPEDVKLMQDLGLKAYRFSTSWARVIPQGVGASNPLGLDFYDKLVDTLLAAGIQPFATLYHWDLPQALQDRGGWANPEIVERFADYADLMTKYLGDRVKNWTTFNEPWVVTFTSHLEGRHAPGLEDLSTALRVSHNLMLSHGAAVPVIRQNVPDAKVGITLDLHYRHAATDKPEDIAAAEREDAYKFSWFLDPIFKGKYPDLLVDWVKENAPDIDMSAISKAAVPIDFLGVNYYMRWLVSHDEDAYPLKTRGVPKEGSEITTMGWEVYPGGLYQILARIKREYNPATIYITENGCAFIDPEPVDGVVEDPRRAAYYKGHIQAVEKAIDEGIPVKGYFAWSLMDNFEWGFGYTQRFGIIYVNYETQERIWKRSAHYYKSVIQANEVV
jgi:beta-glucosidase